MLYDQQIIQKKNLIIITIICFLSFLIISVSAKRSNPTLIETAVVSIVYSFQSLTTQSIENIKNTWLHYIYLTKVQEENWSLREEINKLKYEAHKYKEQEKAFERLNKMLEYKLASEKEKILASVIGVGSISWSKMITIDKGSNDGIKKNMAVVNYEGLVGRIIQTAPNFSKVSLITDVRSAVDSLNQNNRVRGVVVGKGSDVCEMKYIRQEADIKIGDPVISSGLGEIFPKGLLIGTVSQVEEVSKGLFKKVTLFPAVRISFLEEVFILK